MPLPEIARAVRNPKEHDLPAIRKSIEKFGCTVAGELDERTGRLVAGHGRLLVLDEMASEGKSPPEGVKVADDGTWLPPILRGWSTRSDADAEGYLIANNRTPERGGWDHGMLADMLADIGAADEELLAATGYDMADVDELMPSEPEQAPPSGEPGPGPAERVEPPTVWGVVVTCESEAEQVELLERLSAEGHSVRALM
ncbi:hypothetical protein ACIHFD_61850 [Nonomuraea sp. NPDC051941]|uniref:hypothetical protein n=1 Tax=Nonomuraea sp. NPDC051941 TaxID=3364373 RepID=UPI0037CAB520